MEGRTGQALLRGQHSAKTPRKLGQVREDYGGTFEAKEGAVPGV